MLGEGIRSDPEVQEQIGRLREVLGCSELEPVTVGGESRTYLITGTDDLVTVPIGWPDRMERHDDLDRRLQLLGRIADRVDVPVPRVVRALPREGCYVVRRLPGTPLSDLPARQAAAVEPVGRAVGRLLAELHTWDAEAYADIAPVDDYTPTDWLDETAELVRDLEPVLDAAQRRDVREFLARPTPRAGRSAFSHNDLGIEHILVTESGPPRITGVIDWGDAAVTDPAYDFGLLLRDLGPSAFDSALAAYAAKIDSFADIPARVPFYAVCALLEDLAFGHADARPEYVEKSLRGWRWTFDTALGHTHSG
ncbi:phosphotransferase family protein [Nocardia brevicatena]|uniref:phosphotransferase family protein n=1 Tax=Nocardia brevicatena TaxID=37327 RepID=UPI001C3F2C12|nr:aminoglycoside phosphotransferase family protein [Nocardia brevicatena]